MNNEEKINWLGKPLKRKTKPKSNSKFNSNNINYLGMNLKSNVSFLRLGSKQVSQKVNFLGLGKSKKYKMSPSPLFKKESIRKKKRLSKWGDADLDGSPNYFDCDPRNAFKDKIDTSGKVIAEVKERIRQQKEAEKAAKRAEIREKITEKSKVIKGRLGEGTKSGWTELKALGREYTRAKEYFPLEEERRASKALRKEHEEQTKKYLRQLEQKDRILEQEGLSEEEVANIEEDKERIEANLLNVKEKEIKRQLKAEKVSSVEARTAMIKKLMKQPGLYGAEKVARYTIEEKLARGKKPTKKETTALAKVEKRMKKIGDIQQEGKISREILTKVPMGEVGRVLTGAAVDKTGEYSKAVKAKAGRVRRMTTYAAGQIFGENLLRTRFDSEPRGRGRPAGPSGEYRIGGRPVYEAEFQQYSAKQNALNRMLPSQQQSATLNPEYLAYMKAQKASERGETQTVMTEDGMPMEGIPQAEGAEGLPAMGTSMLQTGQQQIEMKEKRAYTLATPDEVKMAQYAAQARDNPLMAPNFMKGELKATGGNILTPIGPSILEAPQVFKGEMRNVVKSNPNEGMIKLGERPQTNPYGDEWLDIEIGSGKPVIRKRIRERWMSGEAL